MRSRLIIMSLGVALLAVGCTPEAVSPGIDGDLLQAVVSTADEFVSEPDVTPVSPSSDPPDSATTTSAETEAPLKALETEPLRTVRGSVVGSGQFELYELGRGEVGDRWTVTPGSLLSVPFVVALFDADQNLLNRMYMSNGITLDHVVRASTSELYLGVMPPAGTNGGDFSFDLTRELGGNAPKPQSQTVWLNFSGASNVSVHRRDPVSFSTFDAAQIGDRYEGATQLMKDAILAEMRTDYAAYNIVIVSSDDGPPPDGPFSTVHFGGDSAELLGLADNVDNYNADPEQKAIVYVGNFAPYVTLDLEVDEMAVMLANVASHELGHLLGLYHTRDPNDLMDTTGSAWDLAGSQSFSRAELEPTVFASGWEDSPALLSQTLGIAGDSAKVIPRARPLKAALYRTIRRFAQEEIAIGCGTCLSLDTE